MLKTVTLGALGILLALMVIIVWPALIAWAMADELGWWVWLALPALWLWLTGKLGLEARRQSAQRGATER